MNLYEFIQPSDSITFYAEDDDVAFAATMIVGNAHCFANRIGEDGKKAAVADADIMRGTIREWYQPLREYDLRRRAYLAWNRRAGEVAK